MLQARIIQRRQAFSLEVDFECRYAVTAVFGPSGSGKTTLLDAVAGLSRPQEGEIVFEGETLFSSARGIDLPPEKRRVGYVFQDDLLFPHLDVLGNLRYGYERLPATQRRFAPERVVDLLELGPLLRRRPQGLSGGERQRVALGRALLA